MIDGCGREIDHLRLSLTDHCNLACRYCVPGRDRHVYHMIDPNFALRLVEWLTRKHGIRHVRLTGGEPLLHAHIVQLVACLSKLRLLHELTLTTNGQALAAKAAALHAAGLDRINVSLDTLDPHRFEWITRGGQLAPTLGGIETAIHEGLTPLKINVVVQRGVNDGGICELAEWGLRRGCIVRFLEVMPIGPFQHVVDQHLVPAAEIVQRLAERFDLRSIPAPPGQPAVDFAVTGDGVRGVIGVIAPTTQPFCGRCRRLRVTSRGYVIPCVHDRNTANLNTAWDGVELDEPRADEILEAVIGRKAPVGPMNQAVSLIRIGG
jgi:cyclic pyranopterin phosphate synthase